MIPYRDEHENEHDLRPPEPLEDVLRRRHLNLCDLGAGSLERLAIHHASVQLLQQLWQIDGDQIDDFLTRALSPH